MRISKLKGQSNSYGKVGLEKGVAGRCSAGLVRPTVEASQL